MLLWEVEIYMYAKFQVHMLSFESYRVHRQTDIQTQNFAQILFFCVFDHFKANEQIKIFENFFRDTILPICWMWK